METKSAVVRAKAHRAGIMYCLFTYPRVLLVLLIFLLAGGTTRGSEYPDRECCDSVPPPPPTYHHATSTTTTTTFAPDSNSSVIQLGESKRNCLEAREFCFKESRCKEALGIFHKVCGLEMVACSTVTRGKCRRVLRTLQRYDYFLECTCNEPRIVDPDCFNFRSMIFHHPCDDSSAGDHEALLMLPKCDMAYKECMKDRSGCFKDYAEFRYSCDFSPDGNHCQASDMSRCHSTWKVIRQSKVFGCICPIEPRAEYTLESSFNYGRRSRNRGGVRDLYHEEDKDVECMEVFNETHLNPCLKPEQKSRADEIEETQETCHHALRSCQEDNAECNPLLKEVMLWCEHSHCEPDRCRSSLQNFYARVGISRRLEVAFCVCRQRDPDGQCLTAMRKLHPTCAQRQANREEKKCHEIAKHCKATPNCRERLLGYEQNCSADAVTGKCTETHRACQFAVTKILGTELHASCVCKGTDFLHQRDCYSYQKLLWSNPCVIESHLALQEELRQGIINLDEIFTRAPLSTTTPAPKRQPKQPPDDTHGTMIYDKDGLMRPPPGMEQKPYDGDRYVPYGRNGMNQCPPNDPRCNVRHTWRSRDKVIPIGGSGRRKGIVNIGGDRNKPPIGHQEGYNVGNNPLGGTQDRNMWGNNVRYPGPNRNYNMRGRNHDPTGAYPPPNYKQPPPYPGYNPEHGSIPKEGDMQSNYLSTDSTLPTSSPGRYCRIKDPADPEGERLWIKEGEFKRFYETIDCSILCECAVMPKLEQKMLPARCQSLGCIPHTNCNTSSANYHHSAPYYQAYRGQCICYSGKFICQRPDPAKYNSLGPGIYLLLGYSKNEMELLKDKTKASEIEALVQIQNILSKKYGFKCQLIRKHHIGENIILSAKLRSDMNDVVPDYMQQRREKDECTRPLQELTEKINARPRHPEVSQDAFLSMFIIAELHVNIPEAHTSTPSTATTLKPSLVIGIILIMFFFFVCERDVDQSSNLRIFTDRLVRRNVPMRNSLHSGGETST